MSKPVRDGRPALGNAPRSKRNSSIEVSAPAAMEIGRGSDAPAVSSDADSGRTAQTLVDELTASFREQVRRSLGIELDDSPTSLAFVDHYLRLARKEDRGPIIGLVAAGAGAYFGELVRREIGAMWIGQGTDPRSLRLLLTPQFIHFCPIDQALEAIVSEAVTDDDPRVPDGLPFDPAFHLRPAKEEDADEDADTSSEEPEDDASWLETRLSDLAPVSEDYFYSLTCRYETLGLMLELLAAKHASEGKHPRELGVDDYVEALTRS